MKKFTLPALIWALAISQTFAQKHLAPGIEPYAYYWGYAVKQMLHAAGYEVPGPHAETDLRPEIETRSEALVLDSIVTYFGYGEGQDSTPMLRNVYTRPAADVEVVTESFFDLDHWVPLSRTSLVSDEHGRVVDAIAFLYDEATGKFVPDSRVELFPHGLSEDQVDSMLVSVWNPELNDYVRLSATWNEFDANGRLTVSVSAIEIFEFPLIFKDLYSYNAEGQLLLVDSYNVEGGELIPAGRQEYGYMNNRLSSITSLVSDGLGGYFPQNRTEYIYTTEGLQEFVRKFDWDMTKNDWKLLNVEAYLYDDEKRPVVQETNTLDEQGIWNREKETYAYGRDQYLSVQHTFSYDNFVENWILNEKKFYYYDNTTSNGPDEPVMDYALFMYPNPTDGNVQVRLVGKVSVFVYTTSGQLVARYALAPGERALDLRQLPAGLYQVRAKSDDDYYSGKLIIQ